MKKKTVKKAPSAAVKPAPKKPSLASRLGLERMELTIKNCEHRAKLLKHRAEKGMYKGELLQKALTHAYWYQTKANSLRK